ncbi:MAG TPA: thioesterase, partial [Chromatiales bacterium]|nr:thioesterase [Chromatiales bacterium]
MNVRILAPSTPAQFRRYYRLRWQVLRQPWNQPPGSERDTHDEGAVHAMAVDNHHVLVGVGGLHRLDARTGQIRYLAVAQAR